MKILIINNAAFISSGSHIYVDERTGRFAKELQDLGHNVAFFQQEISSSASVSHFDLQENNINFYSYKKKVNKIISYLYGYFKLILILLKFDCVYLFYPCNFRYIVYIAKLLGKKSGIYVRGMNGVEDDSSRKLYKHIDIALTVSQNFTDLINEEKGKNIAQTIRPMIKFDLKDVVLNRSYKKSDNLFNILFLGRISADKGILELISAIHLLSQEGYNILCTIVGDGTDLECFKKVADERKLTDIIKFPGAIHDPKVIKSYYESADCYVLPTYHEGFPRTLYEAMIFGTPILTTFVGGISSLMKDGYNCKQIEVKSTESIATQLSDLFTNYETEACLIANNATKTICELLSARNLSHAQQLNSILNKLNNE